MRQTPAEPLIRTLRERCRTCFTCVRECPAKAIRIVDGQAEVMPERCIACGNCVRVCSQGAKVVLDGTAAVRTLLAAPAPVGALLAPSFAAEFGELDARQVIGALHALGFARVFAVAYGADLVAAAYARLLAEEPDRRYIATSCPGIVGYVERYHPELVPVLAPIVSPMVAMARAVRRRHGAMPLVFIGPCIAKKGEVTDAAGHRDVDAALTFRELRELWQERGLDPAAAPPAEFDPPHGGLGGLFAVSRGLLQAAALNEDLTTNEIVTAAGRAEFVEAVREFESGDLSARLLEVLCCQGCLAGAGMTCTEPLFRRRSRIGDYVRRQQKAFDRVAWQRELAADAALDLTRTYAAADQRLPVPDDAELTAVLRRLGQRGPEDELNCGACGYETCREHAAAIRLGLAENEMCLPHTIEQLRATVTELATTQEALVQSEKLAGLGQLAAGIAHEVNNPLGVVLMYAHLLRDASQPDSEQFADLDLIARQAERCKKIVAGLLHFARQNNTVESVPTDLHALVREVLDCHQPPPGITVQTELTLADPVLAADGDRLLQVLTNLVVNAYAAMPSGGSLTVRSEVRGERIFLAVRDTGTGIPAGDLTRIFEPFFTTKPAGKGTGLGLAVSYGIVKMHRGDIRVVSNNDPAAGPTGTTFTVVLPRSGAALSDTDRRRPPAAAEERND